MRILGIDYGEKKIGVAISDESAKFAFPHAVIDNISTCDVGIEIKKICDKNNIGKIVIGQSLDFKNQPNPIMKRIEKFKSFLEEKLKIPVEYENEILTTRQAKRLLESSVRGKQARPKKEARFKNEKIHASAAALILQSYLDRQNMV